MTNSPRGGMQIQGDVMFPGGSDAEMCPVQMVRCENRLYYKNTRSRRGTNMAEERMLGQLISHTIKEATLFLSGQRPLL